MVLLPICWFLIPFGILSVEINFDSAGYTYFVPRAFYITTNLSSEAKKLVVVATMEEGDFAILEEKAYICAVETKH